MIQTNIKKLFDEVGLESIRPTDEALLQMGISRRRFTILVDNIHKTPITIEEVQAIKAWITGVTALNPEEIIGENNSSKELAESMGLTK